MYPVRLGFRVSNALRRIVPIAPQAPRILSLRSGYSSASSGLSKDDIQKRVLDAIRGHQRVDPAKLTVNSSFNDLGIDSLDRVETLFAIEEEFKIDIPDADAFEINTVQQAIDYVVKTPEAS